MASKKRNVIVGQSGGPTSVINSSLAGVYKNAIERGFDKVYGMLHGVQGLLDEQYVDMSTQIHSDLDIELLKRTPSAFLGSCRYKLPEIHENMEIPVRRKKLFLSGYMTGFLRFWTSWRLIPLYISEETTPWIPSVNFPTMPS